LEKVGLFWKKPYFFFKRLKLDNLKKSRAFSKKALLFPEKALLFRLKLRTPAFSTKTAYPRSDPPVQYLANSSQAEPQVKLSFFTQYFYKNWTTVVQELQHHGY
jgi:hypothetical protein